MRALLFGAAVAVALCGSNSEAQVFPLAHALPITIENSDERTTGQTGPVILRQLFGYYAFAHVDSPVHLAVGDQTYDVSSDEQLFSGRMEVWDMFSRHYTSPNFVFCTSGNNYHGRGFLGHERTWPVCLIDEGNDGTFDRVKEVLPAGGPFSNRNFDTRPATPITPVHYTITRDEPGFRAPIIIRYISSDRDGHAGTRGFGEFRVLFLHDDQEEPLDLPAYIIPTSLPATMNILGAHIEVLGFDENGLHYRLLSGMDTEQPHPVYILHAGASAQTPPSQ